MKLVALYVSVLLLSLAAAGQDCNNVVQDGVGIGDLKPLYAASAKLTDQSADVRVVILPSLFVSSGNLDVQEKNMEQRCSSWQSPDGGRKSNLIVFALAPNERKSGIYYGSAWKPALDGRWPAISSNFMSPRFRSKDWVGGLVAGEEQVASRIAAFRDETLHPAPITTVNQSTDMSGFWTFLKLALFLLALAGIGVFIYLFLTGRTKRRNQTVAAQQSAQQSKASLAAELNSARDKITEMQASSDPKAAVLALEYDSVSTQFSRLDQSSRMDPSQDGLTVYQYTVIGNNYQALRNQLSNAISRATRKEQPVSTTSGTSSHFTRKTSKHSKAQEASTSESPKRSSTTVYEDNSVTVVNTPAYTSQDYASRDSEPTHSESSRSAFSHSSDGGGSSSWSSGSSSSDSGGSSSFDSGSSCGGDSGGGGSSDF
jgi:uncharacterized membrane protein YgcG